jgi:hypothetical protein
MLTSSPIPSKIGALFIKFVLRMKEVYNREQKKFSRFNYLDQWAEE